ncbi:hypothetical protein JTE90_014895 [Oedothorax gibbosus]|uniref:Uncharacterized protein n=1 Tax=Oedothorax gibbosus TaxID=931172 RepID=A0AAV6VND1_9ARAC|nr:hypothetical protein JTE90_014895 [Oedothorax gibbosus]
MEQNSTRKKQFEEESTNESARVTDVARCHDELLTTLPNQSSSGVIADLSHGRKCVLKRVTTLRGGLPMVRKLMSVTR